MGALWKEADLTWKDFLPEGEDVHNFLLEQVRTKLMPSYLIVVGLFLRRNEGNFIHSPVIKIKTKIGIMVKMSF